MSPRLLRLLLAGLALVLLVNLIVLSGVAWNRSGEPEAELRLSERELSLPPYWRDREENSGLALTLRWRVAPKPAPDAEDHLYEMNTYAGTHWLGAERLRELGFDLDEADSADSHRRYRLSAREVWLALEFDGPAHAATVRRAEQSLAAAQSTLDAHPGHEEHEASLRRMEEHLGRVRNEWSRLVVIDADLDREALRARHPDRQRIAIMHGRVRASRSYEQQQGVPRWKWEGYVEAVSIDSIHVPLSLRSELDALSRRRPDDRQDRFEVSLAFGKRREPWIQAVHAAASP